MQWALALQLVLVASGLDVPWRAFAHTTAARLSYGEYETPPHIRLISTEIARMVDAGGGLLIVEAPPRHGKSELVSRWVPTWYLAEHPSRHVILSGYGAALPEDHSRFIRDTISEHGDALGVHLANDSTAVDRWHTTKGGSCRAVGVGGALTGFGGHLIVVDDPISNAEEADSEVMRDKIWNWFLSVAWTRREPGCVVVVMHTRWHEGDLVGRILEHPQLGRIAKRLTFRALAEDDDMLGRKPGEPLWPGRYSRQELLDIQAALTEESGARWWHALYRQEPSSAEGTEIMRSWWRFYDDLPVGWQDLEYRLASWDGTFTDKESSDFVVGYVIGVYGGQRYVLDEVRRRMSFVEACEAVAKTHQDWACHASAVEMAANGFAIVNSLQLAIPSVYGVPVARNGKIARARATSPQIKAGQVMLPKLAQWTAGVIDEHAAFPLGKNDDRVDAMSQGLSELAAWQNVPVTELQPTDNRFVPPHILDLRKRGVLGGLGMAPKAWRV